MMAASTRPLDHRVITDRLPPLHEVEPQDRHDSSSSEASSSSPRSISGESEVTSVSSSTAPLITQPAAIHHSNAYNHRVKHTTLSRQSLQQIASNDVHEETGWPLLAKLMNECPEFESFSRFRELNIKNLLYYQVELAALQRQLERKEKKDLKLNYPGYAKYADGLVDSNTDQWRTVLKVRETLHAYNGALLQYSQVSALPDPSSHNTSQLLKWLVESDRGAFSVGGEGSDAWGRMYDPPEGEPSLRELLKSLIKGFITMIMSIVMFWKRSSQRTKTELVSPRPNQRVDRLTEWCSSQAIPFLVALWNRLRNRRRPATDGMQSGREKATKKRVTRPQDNTPPQNRILCDISQISAGVIQSITSSITTIVACLLPTGAIAVLTTVESMRDKLLYIGGFTLLFAIGLTLLTTINSRVQIFTATATFSAVLVVFVQNGN